MGVTFTPTDVTSGYNLSKINENFDDVSTALDDALSRSGTTGNEMNADIDMNGNSIINVSSINVNSLPTSSVGLSTGDIWNDGGTLKVA